MYPRYLSEIETGERLRLPDGYSTGHGRSRREVAGWYVCKWTVPPAVLVEYGFINSEEDVILAKMD